MSPRVGKISPSKCPVSVRLQNQNPNSAVWLLELRYGGLYGGAVGAREWARAGSFAVGVAGYQRQW